MDGDEITQLHRRSEYAYEAIHDCVRDLASRRCVDHLHQRVEPDLVRISWEVTESARRSHAEEAPPAP